MHYKILLLDDDSDDRMLFEDAVNNVASDVSCTTLSDEHDLLSALQAEADAKPKIIFLDINMPGMSGWEVLTLLKDHKDYSDIPIVMYSTSKHQEEITKAKTLGALCFFSKPSDFGILKKGLKIVIEHLKNNTIQQLGKDSDIFI